MVKLICVGLICFVLGLLLASGPIQADLVDPTVSGVVALTLSSSHGVVALDEAGHIWRVTDSGWTPNWMTQLPVPMSEVKLWQGEYFVTPDGSLWNYDSPGNWVYVATWPGGASPIQTGSWGKLKSAYR